MKRRGTFRVIHLMKKPFIYIILAITFALSAHGQEQQFEELKSDILTATTETRKIEGLINLGINLGRLDPDSLKFYADSLSSQDFNSPELVAAGQKFMEAVELYGRNQLEAAIPLFEESTKELKALDVPDLYYRCRNYLGIAYTRARELEKALVFFEETLDEIEAENADVSHRRAAHANLINVFRRAQDFASAIYHSEMLISLSDEGSMSRSLAFSYMNMGQMLLDLQYYERALDAFNTIDPDFLTGSMPLAVAKNQARAHQELGHYDSAIFYFERSINFSGENINPNLKKSSFVSLINLYTEEGNFDKIPPLIDSVNLVINGRDPFPLHADFAIAQMNYLRTTNQKSEALAVGKDLEEYLENNNALKFSQDAFLIMSEIYEEMGNTDLAYKYNKLFTDLEIVRSETRNTNSIQQARARLAELEAERVVNEAEESTAFYQRLSIQQWILLGLLLIICLIIYRFYKKERTEKIFKSGELAELKKEVEQLSRQEASKELSFIKLKSRAVIQLENIKYIGSDGPYVEVFCDNKEKPEIDRNTLKALSEELPDSFIQVHRSYIVNIHYIQSIFSNRLELKDGTEIPVSRSFKPKVELALKASA